MKAYKGFTKTKDGRLMCRDMEYEVGKTYKHKGKIELCMCGFHACHELHKVWNFYPNNGQNVFYEVECGGSVIEYDYSDGKFVCSEITLVQPINMDNVALFGSAGIFFDGFARVELDGKCNFIDTEGKLLSEQWFDYASCFHEGFAMVRLGGKWNFINTKGKTLSDQWFDYAECFYEGFAWVGLNGKWNFINTKGKLLLDRWFDDVCSFSEGFAMVKLNGKWNFISTEGKLLSEQWFDDAWSFSNGFAKVGIGGNIKIINKKGEIV